MYNNITSYLITQLFSFVFSPVNSLMIYINYIEIDETAKSRVVHFHKRSNIRNHMDQQLHAIEFFFKNRQ